MKTMKQNLAIIAIFVVAAVMALPAVAQQFNTFGGTMAPQTSFQSTSTMVGTGSAYSSNPMLNSNGTAVYNGASYGPHKAKKDGYGDNPWGTGESEQSGTDHNMQDPGQPLGDAVLPLMLCALIYAGWQIRKRYRSNTMDSN